MERKNNTIGNVSKFRFVDNEKYSMEDLLYVNSQHESIKRLYMFLNKFYFWTLNKNHLKTATQVVKDGKVDMHILSLLKKYKYIDDKYNWLMDTQPSKADAVFLRIKLKNKRKKQP